MLASEFEVEIETAHSQEIKILSQTYGGYEVRIEVEYTIGIETETEVAIKIRIKIASIIGVVFDTEKVLVE